MGKIKLVASLIVCFALLSPTIAKVSAEEIIIPITGWVYHMITFPVLPEDTDPQMSLEDDLGPYDTSQWRFFRYNPEEGRYDELKSSNWDPIKDDFDFGRGYWIISRKTETIDIQGDPVGAVNWITLKLGSDGWNQIGNIYLQDFTIGMYGMDPECNLWVVPENNDPILEPPYQLNNPLNPYTNVTLQEYAGGSSYNDIGDEPDEVLETGKAYWLRNIYSREVILYFDPAGLAPTSTPNTIDFPGQDFFARLAQQEDPPAPPPAIEGSSSVSLSGSGDGGCFIATATYGDYDHPNVQILRGFRDQYLSTNCLGKMIVSLYYRHSPTWAHFVAKRSSMKALIRFGLVPLMGMRSVISKMNVYAYFAIMASPLLGGVFFLRRRQRVLGRWKVKHSSKSKEGKRKR